MVEGRPCTVLVYGHAEAVQALLEEGADVHAKTNGGGTPLHFACEGNHHDIAAMLRAKGAEYELMLAAHALRYVDNQLMA
jgi:ankyrin repeat protein